MRTLLISFALLVSSAAISQQKGQDPLQAADTKAQIEWVNATYESLSLEERIGQLIFVFTDSKGDPTEKHKISGLIEDYAIGGLLFSVGDPLTQLQLTNHYQALSSTKLMITMDAEWGLSMRLKDAFSFPYNMTLGAVEDEQLVYRVGERLGAHSRRVGVHMNYAPVADINTDPRNPIIGNRSFGSDSDRVGRLAVALARGLQSQGVLGSAKHFPGHGDTATDSHVNLPVIEADYKRLQNEELVPFKALIKEGIASVMVAHIALEAITGDLQSPASLSSKVTTALLQEDLGYNGLVITDALNMKGVSKYVDPDHVALEAFKAGADILLYPENVAASIAVLKEAYELGSLSEERLAHSVKKILKAKYLVGLHQFEPLKEADLLEDINALEDQMLSEELYEAAITTVQNENELLPLSPSLSYGFLAIGEQSNKADVFLEMLQRYAQVKALDPDTSYDDLDFDAIIVGHFGNTDTPWKNSKLSAELWDKVYALSARETPVVLVHFGTPYTLLDIQWEQAPESVVIAYQNREEAQRSAAQVLFGALPSIGTLPVEILKNGEPLESIRLNDLPLLSYSEIPEREGLSSEQLKRVSALLDTIVTQEMSPGGQLVVARNAKVIYERNFGFHTYQKQQPVRWNSIYDVASVTKIAATLPLFMHKTEVGEVSLSDRFKDWFDELKDKPIGEVNLIAALSHNARLPAWIPFYKETLDDQEQPLQTLYARTFSEEYPTQVADSLFLIKDYRDKIFDTIFNVPLESKQYRYSDLPYYIIARYLSKDTDPFEQQIDRFLYKPLGATMTGYHPLQRFDKKAIVPSEIDRYFRQDTIQGFVHDMGAAMLGGVSGHAGLFSNANDITKIMQMFLQGGVYGRKRLLSTETIRRFNTCYYCNSENRRGVGFDKPQLEGRGSTCGCVSHQSFGHLGFTGIYAWADPETQITLVFLSNRTYPTMENNLMGKTDMRTRIQQAVFDSRLY